MPTHQPVRKHAIVEALLAVRARLHWCAAMLATTGLAATVSYAAEAPPPAGRDLEAIGDYAAAAQAYERQATAARDRSDAALAWRAAAALRSDLAQPDMAARDARQWLTAQPAHRNSGHVRHLNFPSTSSSSAASARPNHRFGFIVPRPQSSSSRKTTRF